MKKIFAIFSSLKLTAFIFIFLIVLNVLGSVIFQVDQSQKPIEQLYSPETLALLKTFQLTDIFHSTWFVFSIVLLAINLVCCSIDRLPGIWKAAHPNLDHFKNIESVARKERLGGNKIFELETTAKLDLKNFLSFIRYKDFRTQIRLGTQPVLLLDRGYSGRFGVYIVHLALLFVFAGGLLGALEGFEGRMEIEEGNENSFMELYKGHPRNYEEVSSGIYDLKTKFFLQDFHVEFYPETTQPKSFASDLILTNHSTAAQKTIRVNEPLFWEGLGIYQATYGSSNQLVAHVVLVENGEKRYFDGMFLNKAYQWKDKTLTLLALEKDFQGLGPFVRLKIEEPKKKTQEIILFQQFPDFKSASNSMIQGKLLALNFPLVTGLMIVHDPGVWFVWFGCFWIIIGILIAFFLGHERYYLFWDETKKKLVLYGATHRNLSRFEKKFDSLVQSVRRWNNIQ